MGNWVYEEFASVSSHVCNKLFSICENGFETKRMASVLNVSGRHWDFESKFPKLGDHSCTSDGEFKGR